MILNHLVLGILCGLPTASPPGGAREPLPAAAVACGVDVLADEGFQRLQGRRLGLVTNHTGVTRNGITTVEALARAPGVHLVKLLSPEHGIRGAVDEAVADGRDDATGLPIISLYGPRARPAASDLADIDTIVFDLQDIGTRYYTYISTLGLVLEAAQAAGVDVVVLDRPNPIGGVVVAGPVADPQLASFTAYHPLPIRHGMTVGELARLFNTERGIGAKLEVVPCRNWDRSWLYDRTGLVWINPSPNMRSLTQALLYPGIGWLEATNLATGRGTDAPFERVGAPWINPTELAAAMWAADVPGAGFTPIHFTPSERQYRGQRCGGIQIAITDWRKFDPLKLGLALAGVLRSRYAEHWEPEGLRQLLADQPTYEAILEGRDPTAIEAAWAAELNQFRSLRKRYLLYPEPERQAHDP